MNKKRTNEIYLIARGIILLVLLFSFSGDNYTLVKSIPVKADLISTDVLGNLYAIHDQTLEKYDASGKQQKTFAHKNSGTISSVDARDPMKVLLFFANFSRVVFLDNTLSQQGEAVNLTSLGYTEAGPVCSSAQGGLWVYNGFTSELVKLNDQYQRTQTVNLSSVLDLALKPDFMQEAGDRIYMNNPASGILIFDSYGTYIKTIPIQSLHGFQVKEDVIVFFKEGKLKTYNIKSFEEIELKLPSDSVLAARVEKNRLYVKKKESVDIYSSE